MPERVMDGRDLIAATLREVVETLAPLERSPCSPGERQAAEWLAERMRTIPGVQVALEDEPSWGSFPPTLTGLGALGTLAAALVLSGRRVAGGLLAAAALGGILDEADNGPRVVRRVVRRRRRTVNLVARLGDQRAAQTLVVLAHHDAPQTGVLFDQTFQRRLYERAPWLIERFKTPLPQWWLGLAGPLTTIAGALDSGCARRRARAARAGLVLGAIGTALLLDMWRSPTVPGANDNLSGVAALVALAELLAADPVPGLRVLLASCGAEETMQDGIRAFMRTHRHELAPESTCFVNLDTVGSPHLVMLEAEGPVRMEPYHGPWLRDLVEERAAQLGIQLWRGFRARSSTDSVIPSRAGHPTATLVSMTAWRAPANYHLPSDVPENLDYGTVAEAARLVHGVCAALVER
ncbi:MAG TPA: M28 family peptidase [Solirubrobacteraceae bacterium]|nr:M28 family peptidase [Solirubrobacteraceae bacterium]